ncbi:Uma2 family endonuclease [Neorhodopirellula pilleata]|nr:Uma2 family endonuclease [Neorhodopirellula pilleata]
MLVKLSGTEFDSMVDRGAFDGLEPKKIELIRGELRFMSPAGPIHDDLIRYLTNWSVRSTSEEVCSVQVQSGFVCHDDRPEPDILWLKPRRYGSTRPSAADALLLIEVADSSLASDLQEKAEIYAEAGVVEYWVVDIPNRRIHVMSDIQSRLYQSITIHTTSDRISPQCHRAAILPIAELFDFD